MKTLTLSNKSKFRRLIVLCSLFMLMSASSFAQQASTYKQTVKKMIEVSGSMANFNMVIGQMVSMFKQQKPEVPKEFWTEFEATFMKAGTDDLLDMLTPIYQKHMTEADLISIIAFYQSPAGKKLAEKTPLITQESMQVGQQWGMKVGAQFVEKLKEKGYQ